jgi:hypothetical protein
MTTRMKRSGRSGLRTRDHLRVGRPDVRPSAPAHTPGNREGNQLGSYERMRGHFDDDTSDARRSTGVGAERKNPILPGMPNLSPP